MVFYYRHDDAPEEDAVRVKSSASKEVPFDYVNAMAKFDF